LNSYAGPLGGANLIAQSDAPMIDPFGRAITYLRVSVTDRCDFRCTYCMAENMTFLPKKDLLTLEELNRLCSTFIAKGVRKLRLTGGEPLVRKNIMHLVRELGRQVHDGRLDELTLTTNGSQLARHAASTRLMRRSSGPSPAGASSPRFWKASTPRRPPACTSRSTPSP
jgi:GTP 3',8-cyclase